MEKHPNDILNVTQAILLNYTFSENATMNAVCTRLVFIHCSHQILMSSLKHHEEKFP